MSEGFEVIDAFVDGERVDPRELKRALSDQQGLNYMVDAWLLRESVQDEIALDPPLLMPALPARLWAGRLMVAAVAVICLTAGYFAGSRLSPAPVTPAAQTAVTGSTAPTDGSLRAPAPTRVIRLQQGVDWKEGTGGD